MSKFLQNLKHQAEQNPIAALAVGVAVVTAASKLLSVGVEMQNASAWKREVTRRAMKDAIR